MSNDAVHCICNKTDDKDSFLKIESLVVNATQRVNYFFYSRQSPARSEAILGNGESVVNKRLFYSSKTIDSEKKGNLLKTKHQLSLASDLTSSKNSSSIEFGNTKCSMRKTQRGIKINGIKCDSRFVWKRCTFSLLGSFRQNLYEKAKLHKSSDDGSDSSYNGSTNYESTSKQLENITKDKVRSSQIYSRIDHFNDSIKVEKTFMRKLR